MQAQPAVHEQLCSKDFLERIRGINRIDEIETASDQIEALLPIATEDPNQQVRYAAISRMSSLDETKLSAAETERVLAACRFVLVNDSETQCQAGAADAIAGLKLLGGFEDLVNTFERTDDWMLKFSIAAGMGEMGDARAFGFLTGVLEKLDESDMLLLAAVIGALGELGDQRGLEVVERYLENEDSAVKERANIAHRMLLGKE